MSNNQVVENKNYADILNALNEQFATNVNRIYIHSLDREVGFREIKVAEQKTLAKIFIDNENRPDIIYDAQVALIENLCLEKENVNFKELTELDRIKIMIELYQSNFFKNSTSFKCKECGTENKYEIDFENLIQKINNEKFDNILYEYTDKTNRSYEFILGFPSINRLSKFHKLVNLSKRNKLAFKIDQTDLLDMFIKKITIINNGNKIIINSNDLKIEEFENILEKLPIDILYGNEGIINIVSKTYFDKLDNLFNNPKCSSCGIEHSEGVTSIGNFFI